MSSSAIKAAPDFNYWYEVGPTYNLSIHDNVIEKCSFRSTVDPDIVVFTKHSTTPTDVEHLHKNITIENNVIKRSLVGCVSITATDGVTIRNNRFEGRQNKEKPAVTTHNCTDVVIENNTEI
jgi:parallel beta-helix repeat protein